MCHRFAVFLLLFLGVSLLHGGELSDASAMDILDNTRIIKAGDLLSIHVLKASKEPEIITVSSNGEVKHLVLLRPIPAAGLTCRTLAFNIRRQLEQDYLAGTQIVLVKFASLMDVLDDRHIVAPGDTVSVRVIEDRRDAEQFMVPKDGMIQIRYVGAVKAEGMTCKKLAQFIRQKLVAVPAARRPFYSEAPTVVVAIDRMTCGLPSMDELDNNIKLQPGWTIGIRIVEDKREALQQVIAVTGEVQAPYVGLVKAGGLTCGEVAVKIKGELEKAFFLRATVIVNLEYKESGRMILCPGSGKPIVSVLGNVAKTGKYDFPEEEELTVSSFLMRAGGHISKNLVPKITILRKTPLGTKMILVNSRAVLVDKSEAYDLFLRSDDVMLVE